MADVAGDQFNPADVTHPDVNYDEGLQTTQVISRRADVIKVTYLHVTINELTSTSH